MLFLLKTGIIYFEMRGKKGQQHHTEKLLHRKKQIMGLESLGLLII